MNQAGDTRYDMLKNNFTGGESMFDVLSLFSGIFGGAFGIALLIVLFCCW